MKFLSSVLLLSVLSFAAAEDSRLLRTESTESAEFSLQKSNPPPPCGDVQGACDPPYLCERDDGPHYFGKKDYICTYTCRSGDARCPTQAPSTGRKCGNGQVTKSGKCCSANCGNQFAFLWRCCWGAGPYSAGFGKCLSWPC